MQKRYIVRLSESEKSELHEVIKRLNGSSQKVRRAQILLKADAEGPNWTDQSIAEAFNCRPQTVENIRRRLGEHGFEASNSKFQLTDIIFDSTWNQFARFQPFKAVSQL